MNGLLPIVLSVALGGMDLELELSQARARATIAIVSVATAQPAAPVEPDPTPVPPPPRPRPQPDGTKPPEQPTTPVTLKRRHVTIVTANNCVLCRNLYPKLDAMRAAGWDVGPGMRRAIRLVNRDLEPAFHREYSALLLDGVPVLLVREDTRDDGRIIEIRRGRDVSRLTTYGIAELAQPGLAAQQPARPELLEPEE
jgi:hypothetical protein